MSEQRVAGESPAVPGGKAGSGARLRAGVVLGHGHATVVELSAGPRSPGPAAVHVRQVGLPDEQGGWPALAGFLREVREAAGAREGDLALVVLRPLAHLKVLRLPPLRGEQLRTMVALNAERFFPRAAGGLLTGLVRVPGGRHKGAMARVAAAGVHLVEAACAAAAEAGCSVGHVTVGPAALLGGALARCPALRRGRTALAVLGGGGCELLCLDRGRLRIARSAPGPRPEGKEVAEWLRRALRETRDRGGYVPDRVLLAGGSIPGGAVEVEGVEVAAAPELAGCSMEVLAAYGAAFPSADTPLLLREAQRLAIRSRQRRRTAVLCTLSAALLAAAAAINLGQLRREVEEVRSQRERIRPAVAQALRVRREIQEVRTRVEVFERFRAGRSDHLGLIAALTDALPREAHLASLARSGEELRVDGQARSATALVPVFEAAPWVRSVRLGSPVRREQTPAGVRERFSLTLQLRPIPAGPGAPAAANGSRR